LESKDKEAWLGMRAALWPNCSAERHVTEMHSYFSDGGLLATFVAAERNGSLCGFVEASLRPFAEGCTTKPVAYIEGIFVRPEVRRLGIGRRLVAAVESWGASCGCVEFASDCQANNEASIRFHERVGFDISKRLIHFRRGIPDHAEA
jgi:aminoglycoside 6'-N-acetyltransferase I